MVVSTSLRSQTTPNTTARMACMAKSLQGFLDHHWTLGIGPWAHSAAVLSMHLSQAAWVPWASFLLCGCAWLGPPQA